jgi:hypothetical protein
MRHTIRSNVRRGGKAIARGTSKVVKFDIKAVKSGARWVKRKI